jgi:hypothetical protein|tara:strand:- start:46 stop:1074 length:1029 start_codon:yes stop_codon:yes gene_type:complete
MAHKLLKQLLVFAAAVLSGCTTNLDYYIVGTGTEVETEIIYETVYEEVEVPVYIEVEVPAEPGAIWIDSFIQPMSVDGVDIIWVIDTSGSMNRYDAELLAGIEAMLLALPDSGWRLAMMSNDPSAASIESQFPLVPGDDITDAEVMYQSIGRGGREEGFDASYEYLVNNSYAQTWLRYDAALLVVFVSDEEEQSDDHFPIVGDYIDWYKTQRNGSVFLSSIVNIDPSESLCNTNPYNNGDRYDEATSYFGGVIVDICSSDWSAGVADATSRLEPYEFIELTYIPIESSIRVFINGSLNYDWTYSDVDNTIYFTIIPGGNDLVEVGYRYYPTPEAADTGDTGL